MLCACVAHRNLQTVTRSSVHLRHSVEKNINIQQDLFLLKKTKHIKQKSLTLFIQ